MQSRHLRAMRAMTLFPLLVTATACRRTDEAEAAQLAREASAPIHVQSVSVVERPMPDYLTLTGTLRANAQSDIAADVSGKITQTFVERGQKVKRGQLLAVIDSRVSGFMASATEAQFHVAESQLDEARRDCDRVKHLLEAGAISQAEFDRQTAACTSQQWSAVAAQAQHQQAAKVLGDSAIRAPFDGIVGERFVNVGQYLDPRTAVASLYQPDPIRIQLTVPESNIPAASVGTKVSFSVAAYPNESFVGTVQYVSPNVRESTRDLVVEALVPNADGRLRPGMFASGRMLLGQPRRAVVPESVLVRDDSGARLFVVVGSQIEERTVQIGESLDGVVAVLHGVRAGDRVVDKPGPEVRDGARVE
jgi:RND family efflux transporter MFP subunit